MLEVTKKDTDSSKELKPNPDQAEKINNVLKYRMSVYKGKLEALLRKINERLQSNTSFLIEEAQSTDLKDEDSFKSSYARCGMPFFKDAHGFPAPENADYKHRKNVLNEFFPYHLTNTTTRWTTKDKIAIVNGVKNQMIDFIKMKQSQKICQEVKTRKKLQKLRFVSTNQDFNEMSISDLNEIIDADYPLFSINWNLISFKDLQSSHSVTECMGIWYSYLKPDINRDPFTDDENAILSHVVVENKYQDWNEIAQYLDRRTCLQTFVYFFSSSSRLCPPNVRWTAEEDEKLLEAVKTNNVGGNILWPKVGVALNNRNKTQCYNRYVIINKYSSEKKGVFSPSENRVILNYVAKFGENFTKIPKDLLPQRSMVQIKNHYNVALKHKGQVNPWTYEEDVQLMEFVDKEGSNWSKLSEMLQTHNRLSCRTRYVTISKFLKNNPKKTLKDVPSRLKTVTAVQKAVLNDNEYVEQEEGTRTKSFGLQTFKEFRIKNRALYSMLKTTYNFDLSKREVNIDNKKFLILKHLLNIGHGSMAKKQVSIIFTKNQLAAIKSALKDILDAKFYMDMNLIKDHVQFLLPPNLNTTVGLRSLTIKMIEDPLADPDIEEIREKTKEYIAELEIFRKLFFSLFYWTAMVAKIDETELRETHLVRYPKTDAREIFSQINRYNLNTSHLKSLKRANDEKVDQQSPSKNAKLS